MTQLGGTNVQASAPEVRDMLEKGVADAVTFPWGSMPLFGIDKVTKYHMDVPLYATSFVWVMNKAKYDEHVGGAEEGDRRPLHHRMGAEGRRRRGPISSTPASPSSKAEPGHEVYTLTPTQLAEWSKAAEPVVKTLGRRRARRPAATPTRC